MANKDTRVLHVSSKYKNLENTDVATKLKSIHDNLYKQFTSIADGNGSAGAGSREEAKILQDFMQKVKKSSSDPTFLNSIQDSMTRQVIESVVSLSMKSSGTGTKSLFYYMSKDRKHIYKQGEIFEKQLSAVVASTIGLASGASRYGIKKATKAVNLGKAAAGMIDTMAQELVKNTAEALDEQIEKSNKAIFSNYVTVEKDAKIDVSGMMYQTTLTASPTTYLFKIASLLQKANFTAKSYRSETKRYDRIAHEYVIKKTQKATLHLGHAEAARSLLTVLSANQTPAPVALSMYYYIMNTSSTEVKRQAARLRFIYELTGYGQHYQNELIQNILGNDMRANYIIYNDPAGDGIYVRSTADIIKEMWNSVNLAIERRAVELEKKMFY